MKKLSIILAMTIVSLCAFSQPQSFPYKDYSFQNQANIGGGIKSTNASAWLELGPSTGSTKGILFPRGDRNQVVSPVIGLLFYDVNDKKVYQFDGSVWQVVGGSTGSFIRDNSTGVPQTATINITGSATIGGDLIYSSITRVQNGNIAFGYAAQAPGVGGGVVFPSTNGGFDNSGGFITSTRTGPWGNTLEFYTRDAAGSGLKNVLHIDGEGSGNVVITGRTVLGNLTTAPTGTNGAMYYNTTSNTFQVYRNGNWWDIPTGSDYIINNTGTYTQPQNATVNVSNAVNVYRQWTAGDVPSYPNFGGASFKGTLYLDPNNTTNVNYHEGVYNNMVIRNTTGFDYYGITNFHPIMEFGNAVVTFQGYGVATLHAENRATGTTTVGTWASLKSSLWLEQNSTIGTFYGLKLESAYAGGFPVGTITNEYGIYQESTTAKNVFNGVVKFANLGSNPTGGNGSIYYNTVSNTFQVYQNGSWATLTSTGTMTYGETITETATDYTVGSETNLKIRGTTSGVTITLPDPTTCNGRVIWIQNHSGFNATLSPAVTIANTTTTTSLASGHVAKLVSNGVKWYIFTF